ncbi:MAG: 5-carboxymethyl-2-hydroxymuconate isomerase, partial [Acidobacteria bacterium]|nr:5-carboxymethyl-2-hydroxymuconate isomerase [Acidobacteriota bacterium]
MAVDLVAAARALAVAPPARTLLDLVEAGDEAARRAWELAERAAAKGIAARPFETVRPRAPIPRPRRNIVCLGKNYRAHAREVQATALGGDGLPARPIFFTKATTTVIGPGEPIPSHREL